jgi:chromosome transmission fidelity protein 4
LTLLHWRSPSQARWVPVLDTTQLARLASGRKTETYWPVAVAQDRFHCIILKGGDKNPYFPRPLLSDFEFHIPVSAPPKQSRTTADGDAMDEDGDEDGEDPDVVQSRALEAGFLLHTLRAAQLRDLVASTATSAASTSRAELTRHVLEADKSLLQLLAAECRAGEERGMKALELVGLMRDRSGRMIEAAQKVATRFGRDVLGQKIMELGERRLVGLDGDEDDES